MRHFLFLKDKDNETILRCNKMVVIHVFTVCLSVLSEASSNKYLFAVGYVVVVSKKQVK